MSGNLSDIVTCRVHPAIGVARVGNSASEFFIGPEVPRIDPNPGSAKDAQGGMKRQAARFRVYGFDSNGHVVAELTSSNADISWSVHVANKKAAWYRFELAMDSPEAQNWPASIPMSTRRNASISGTARNELIIDPGPTQISGDSVSGVAYEFNSGMFMGEQIYLGELQTDSAGRLLVLGGRGNSGTPLANNPAVTFGNNDGWYDDISDGPVTVSVSFGGKTLTAEPAWVVVVPPDYAPGIESVVTMYDIARQANLDAGRGDANRTVSFTRDILPILRRLTHAQWVNQGFLEEFGWASKNDLTSYVQLTKLAGDLPASSAARKLVFSHFRNPSGRAIDADLWPPIYGDCFNQPPERAQQYLSVTREQYRCLKNWGQGNFIRDWNPKATIPQTLGAVNLAGQPGTLDEAGLSSLTGGPFHPGPEATWVLRIPSMYRSFCRLRVRQASDPAEPDYGATLIPDVCLGTTGPLHKSGPGDLTRWMAVPWQTDTASCGSAYPNSGTSAYPDLPTFWPVAAPNKILTQSAYEKVLNEGLPLHARQAAFRGRVPWARRLPENYFAHLNAFVTQWPESGVIRTRVGPADGKFPSPMHVETENTHAPAAAITEAARAMNVDEDEVELQFADFPSMPPVEDWRAHR